MKLRDENEVYRFTVRAEDPEGNRGDVDFYITIDLVIGGLFNYLGNFAKPFKLIGAFLVTLLFWLGVQGVKKGADWEDKPTLEFAFSVVVFLVSLGLV